MNRQEFWCSFRNCKTCSGCADWNDNVLSVLHFPPVTVIRSFT